MGIGRILIWCFATCGQVHLVHTTRDVRHIDFLMNGPPYDRERAAGKRRNRARYGNLNGSDKEVSNLKQCAADERMGLAPCGSPFFADCILVTAIRAKRS